MKARVLGLFLVLPLLLAGGDPKTLLEFKKFAPKGAGYSLLMPGDPKESKQKVPTPLGDIEIIQQMVQVTPSHVFFLAYSDYPEAAVKGSSEEKMLDGARDGAVSNVKGKLLSEKKIKLGKHPGREIVVDIPAQGQFRSRMYLVGNRLYQVMVGGTKDQITSKDADKYLDSFKLTAK